MPAAILDELAWAEVKQTAIALNDLRRAADQYQISYDAVKQRASREAWPVGRRLQIAVKNAQSAQRNAIVERAESQGLSPVVTSSTDAIANQLAEDSNVTKTGFSRAARTVAESAGTWKAPKVLKNARELRDVATIAGKVHGWDESKGDDRRVMINIGILAE